MLTTTTGVGNPQRGQVIDFPDVIQDIGGDGGHGQADVVDGAGPGAVHDDGGGEGVGGED